MLAQIFQLIKKDFTIDFRQGFALTSVFLFAVTTVFMCYKIFFWIIFLFAALNAILRSFVQESGGRELYYFSLLDPIAVLFSKIIYNTLFLFVLGTLTFLVMALFTGNSVREIPLFFMTLGLGSVGLSIAFTFVTAIGSKSNNNATLIAILAFPISLGIMLLLIKLSADALGLINDTSLQTDVIMLLAINAVLLGLSIILFPLLWKN
jgi:heme exporter protein B